MSRKTDKSGVMMKQTTNHRYGLHDKLACVCDVNCFNGVALKILTAVSQHASTGSLIYSGIVSGIDKALSDV
jgi:hypothetical protein